MTKSVFCKDCGQQLADLLNSSLEQRSPCPYCGSVNRVIHVQRTSTIVIGRYFSALKFREYMAATGEHLRRILGFREDARQNRVTFADQSDEGSMSYSIIGSSPQNEDDTRIACQLLIDVLNASSGRWVNLKEGDGPVDFEASDSDIPDQKLSMQVIRAIVDESLWAHLNHKKEFHVLNTSKEKLVAQVKQAIEKKIRKYPQAIRQGIVLVLDANRLPILGFDDVRVEFQHQLGDWAKSAGFQAIWLVGSDSSLTWKIY